MGDKMGFGMRLWDEVDGWVSNKKKLKQLLFENDEIYELKY